MKRSTTLVLIIVALISSCVTQNEGAISNNSLPPLIGTWKLIEAIVIDKGDTTTTDYTQKVSFIKIINDSHFAFLQHDLNNGKDSTAVVFTSGGGSYSLKDTLYTEHLEYCSDREWEGNDFIFGIKIKNDTLVQSGIEKIESAGVNRLNIEKYVRVKQ
ncbi:MAG: hypothetical protein R2822_14260 [Spirosomataceae bacterium]